MKVISIGTDRKIFEQGSPVRWRQEEYGKLFEELHIIVFNLGSKLEKAKISENVWIYPTNSKNKLFYFFDAFNISKKIIGRNKNIIVTTQDPFETGAVGLALKLFYNTALQVQVHTDFANKYFISHSFLNAIRFAMAEVVLGFADSVRAVSNRIASSVHNKSEAVTVLPVYVKPDKRPLLRAETEKGNAANFLTVSRLESEKDITTSLEAFKKVVDAGIKATFTILGEGNEKEKLENLISDLNLGNKVIFEGWKNDLRPFYEKADIYVSSSLYEGYGMSVMEAAYYALPLILTNAGIAGEIFRNGEEALISSPKDERKLAENMIILAENNGKRFEMGKKAKLAAEKTYISHEDYLSKYYSSVNAAYEFHMRRENIFKKNILARYLLAGIISAASNLGLLYIFTEYFNIWYLYSSVLAFAVATIVSFSLQKMWTFGDKEMQKMHYQFGKYLSVAFLGIIINTISLFILVDTFKLWYILAQIVIGVGVAVFNFLMYKFFIFNKKMHE